MEKETQSNWVLFHVSVPGSSKYKNQGHYYNFMELFFARPSLWDVKSTLRKTVILSSASRYLTSEQAWEKFLNDGGFGIAM